MIVPRSRLLYWVGWVVLPFSLLVAAVPDSIPLALAAMGVLAGLALLDGVLARRRLEGLGVELPPLLRLSKDRAADLELRIRNDRQKPQQVRIGLALPPELDSPHADLLTSLPEASPCARVFWPCTPLRRGRYQLEHAYLEALSPLGFWAVRSSVPLEAEVRVYPNLLTERQQVAALFLQRGGLGLHTQRQVGKGREFEKLRDYIPGDGFDEIHWKATAKRGRPVTKVFQIERTQEVYVVIDASRLSARLGGAPQIARTATLEARGDSGKQPVRAADSETRATDTVLERFITSALILGMAAERQGDLFGLVTFSDRLQNFVRAKNGRPHYNTCRDALYTLEPRIVTPDFGELASFLRLRLRRRALLVFLTALDDPILAESFVHSVELISRQHLVLVNMLQPAGARPLFTGQSPESLDEVYERLGGHLLWHDLRELGKVLQRRGVQLSSLEHESLSAQLVSQYLAVKQRQLL